MTTIPDSVRCTAYQPGHQPHYIQARLLLRSAAHRDPSPVAAVEVVDATTLRIVLADGTARTYRNHQPERARAAWSAHPEGTVLYPSKALLGVRHREEDEDGAHEGEYLFSLGGGEFRSCDELAASFSAARSEPR